MRTSNVTSKTSRTARHRLRRKPRRTLHNQVTGITLVLPDGVRLEGLRRQTIIDLLLSL